MTTTAAVLTDTDHDHLYRATADALGRLYAERPDTLKDIAANWLTSDDFAAIVHDPDTLYSWLFDDLNHCYLNSDLPHVEARLVSLLAAVLTVLAA